MTNTEPETGDLATALGRAAELLRVNPAAASLQAREILRHYPNEKHATVLLASAERRCGRPEMALGIAATAVEASPGLAIAHEELGLSMLGAGRADEAETVLLTALALDDRLATAWKALGDIRAQRGDQEGSRDALHKYNELSAGDPDLLEAAQSLYSGRLGVAEQLCREFLKRNPTNVSGIRMLAEIGIRLDRLEDAEKLLARCLELAPDFHLARHDFANLLFKKLRYDEALAEIEKAIKAEPDKPAFRLLKASILARVGDTESAIAIYDNVLERFPAQPRVHLSRGHALKTVGHQQEAIEAYRSAVKLQPELGEAHWSLANLKTFEFGDNDVRRMRNSLESGALSVNDYFHLAFSLAKALEDKGEFDESFQWYARGNAVRRKTVRWNADEHRQNLQQMKEFFQPPFFEARGETGDPSSAPIFIVGLPRAGSTLLEQILASHSQVEGTMELPDVISIARRLSGKQRRSDTSRYPQVLAELGAKEIGELGTEYIARTEVHRSGVAHFIDKMPNNFAHIGLIHLMLPNAKIIDARRHPMACCFSGFKQLFASGQNFSYSLEEIGQYYLDYVDFMLHWEQVLPGRVLRVDYESVVANTETEIRRMLDYCGLAFEPRCMEFHRTERAVRTASSEQVRQPIYSGAVEQWRNFETNLGPLKTMFPQHSG